VGLVGIQIYWINTAIAVKETNFVRSVNESASSVITKLEKIEIANQIKRKSNYYQRGSDLFKSIDSINYLYYHEIEKLSTSESNLDQIHIPRGNITIQINEQDQEPIIILDTSISGDNYYYIPPSDLYLDESAIIQDTISQNRINRLLEQKSQLFNDVFEDMYTFRHFLDIESRIIERELDSLIKSELLQNGVKTTFEYGIYSPSRNKLVMEKTGQFSNQLMEESYAYALFPSDMFTNPDYLMIFFPHEKKYLITQMSGMLAISIILILVIIISFFLTITFVMKQRKFAEMKNDFINNMTHEFKTPVSTIALACEALSDKDIQKTELLTENYIHVINEENRRLGNMAEKILQTAVLEKGKLKLNKEAVNIHEVILEVIKNIGIQVEINDGVIEKRFAAESPIIEADIMHITNLIFNLLENANKYSPKKPHIIISTKNINEGLEISIKDNGIGISKTDQKKIFDKLYRVPTGDIHDFKGFGLGLNYVKAIVEKHGGDITLESELNKGSTFTVYLPAKAK